MKDKNRNHRDNDETDDDTDRKKTRRKECEKELERLQSELCVMQDWIKTTGQRIRIVFEPIGKITPVFASCIRPALASEKILYVNRACWV